MKNETRPRLLADSSTNLTVKSCPPFLDSMISGYTIPLPCDVFIEKNQKNNVDFRWRSELQIVSGHSKEQVAAEQIPDDYVDEPFKWTNLWSIELPAGYSALFVHPLNRTDLPFYTLSGVVDADSYNLPVHLPFILKKNFSGLIPAGTPIAQVIPIKRETWEHSVKLFDKEYKNKNVSNFFVYVYSGYKKKYWSRKSYK